MSQFAAYIQTSETLKFVMLAGALYTFGQPFVDMLGVFRCTEHLYARIIAQDPSSIVIKMDFRPLLFQIGRLCSVVYM